MPDYFAATTLREVSLGGLPGKVGSVRPHPATMIRILSPSPPPKCTDRNVSVANRVRYQQGPFLLLSVSPPPLQKTKSLPTRAGARDRFLAATASLSGIEASRSISQSRLAGWIPPPPPPPPPLSTAGGGVVMPMRKVHTPQFHSHTPRPPFFFVFFLVCCFCSARRSSGVRTDQARWPLASPQSGNSLHTDRSLMQTLAGA